LTRHQTRGCRGEAGETLAELLVTIVLLGIAIVAIVGGLGDAILSSNVHRGHASAGALARSTAECLKDRTQPYRADGNYGGSGCIPSGVTVSTEWWTGSYPVAWGAQNANGLQQLTITADSGPSSEAVTILKRNT
jgi:hypothetical protein